MEAKNLYKLMRIPSLADVFAKRSEKAVADRQEKRREFFWGARVQLEQSPRVEKKKHSRAEMLKKWKAEKIKKLEEEKKKQKPIFKVGVVQRKVTGSPVITQQKTYHKKTLPIQQTSKNPRGKNLEVERPGVLTRARAKNMDTNSNNSAELKKVFPTQNKKFCKIEAGKRKQIDSYVFKVPETVSKLSCKGLTYPYSPKLLKRDKKTVKSQEKKVKVKEPAKKETKSVEEILAEKTQVEQRKRTFVAEEANFQSSPVGKAVGSPDGKETEGDDYRPIVYSPFVTVRSGKKSKRKCKKSLSMNVEEQIKEEESKFKCRIFSFRKYIESEKKRLLEMCDKWKQIYQEFQEVPSDVEGDIDSVVGKTHLLTSDKFMQFKGLIEKCENGDPFVKIDDLQGFQDWVSIEVEKIDEEFHKLEKRKLNDWKSETVAVDVTKVQKVKVGKNGPKKLVGKSNIRSHILAARKLLKEGKANVVNDSKIPTFETTVKAVTPKKKESLLKGVLNSETKKKTDSSFKKSLAVSCRRNSGLEIMFATQKNKCPTPRKLQKSPLLTDFEIIIRNENTPSGSILKKTPKTSNSKGHVTFKHNTENALDGRRGLSEKYFQPVVDDDFSPVRTILGDVGNLTPAGMKTRSRTRQMSSSVLMSPQVN